MGVTLLDQCFPRYWMKSTKFSEDVIYINSQASRGKVYQEGFFVGDLPDLFSGIGKTTWCEVNITGNDRFSLTADRSRIAKDDESTRDKISELHSELVEILYERALKKGRVVGWWRYHGFHYPNRMKIVPKALRQAVRNTRFCTFDKEGFRNRKIDEIRDWQGDLYCVGHDSHDDLEYFKGSLDNDSLVLIAPTYFSLSRSEEENYEWWYSVIAEAKNIKRGNELNTYLGIKHYRFKIDEKTRIFVDTGYCLNKWRFKIDWIGGQEFRYATLYDYNDPFSKIIIERCSHKLPRESHQAVFEIFRSAYRWSSEKLKEKQVEAVELMRKEGVIPPSVEFKPSDYLTYIHKCSLNIWDGY